MSLGPKRGRCLFCGHDHGDGSGFPLTRLESSSLDELTRLRAENTRLEKLVKFFGETPLETFAIMRDLRDENEALKAAIEKRPND